MRYRALGRTGLEVSALCLGTMTFGGRTDAALAGRIIDHAYDVGINFIDTADAYHAGLSEEVVGTAVTAKRSHWIVATKVGNAMGGDRNHKGLSRRWLVQACEASLKRLKTDRIDVYYLHREDPRTPLAETVDGLAELYRAGKIAYVGVSNFRAWRMAELVRLCAEAGLPGPAVCQPYYNALNRQPEVEVLPAAAHFGMGVVPYSPLARGVLTGKYVSGVDPDPESRVGVGDVRMLETEWRTESLAIVETLRDYCGERGISPIAFALNWLWANRIVTSVIAGPRTFAHWEAYLEALDAPWTKEDEEVLARLVPAGHASTPGYNDPRYPIEGRAS